MEIGPEIWGPFVAVSGFVGSQITKALKSKLVQDQAKRIKALEDAKSEALARATTQEASRDARIDELERQVAAGMERLRERERACQSCEYRAQHEAALDTSADSETIR